MADDQKDTKPVDIVKTENEAEAEGSTPANTPAQGFVFDSKANVELGAFKFGDGAAGGDSISSSLAGEGGESGSFFGPGANASSGEPTFNFAPSKDTVKVEDDDDNADAEEIDITGGAGGMLSQGAIAELLANNPELLMGLQQQLMSVVGMPSGFMQHLPPEVKRRVRALRVLQEEYEKMEDEFDEAKREAERAFLAKCKANFDKRVAIITGSLEPADNELGAELSCEDDEDDDIASASSEGDREPATGVPKFWYNCLVNSPVFQDFVSEVDEDVLSFLTNIETFPLEGTPGFTLVFTFAENPFFTNSTLTKSYYFEKHRVDGIIFDHAEGCKIEWKDNKAVATGDPLGKSEKPSFFDFFSPASVPENTEEMDNDDLEELESLFELDYEIGEEIKSRIIPQAILWYTGKAVELSSRFDDEMFGMGGFGEDDDEEEYSSDPDGDYQPPEAPQECNQQ